MIFTTEKSTLTLSELNLLVKETIELTMPDTYWVQAELAGINESRGHCYMELVEMSSNRVPVAQARACCWRNTWQKLAHEFAKATGEEMHRGMKVLLKVQANFHIAYGFSWIVIDADPTYTMGDMARRRQEIIRQLKEEGVYDLNKTLSLSPFAMRIAVISSATAAGYGDFCNQLEDNEYGFRFETRLFHAIMQGEQVEQSIIQALHCVHEVMLQQADAFDAVVIIRGGGSTADLSGFDTLALAENVANFPLPVITGIGHERDMSVIDMVACRSLKTPTAVAAFLIDNLAGTLEQLEDYATRIHNTVKQTLERERLRLSKLEQWLSTVFGVWKLREENRHVTYMQRINSCLERRILTERNRLNTNVMQMNAITMSLMQREQHRIELLGQRIKAVDPANILRRGYSITMHDGHAVTDASLLHKGDNITVIMANGQKDAVVS